MKTQIKIVILILFLSFAFSGVMLFYKTRVSPPIIPRDINYFYSDLDQCRSELNTFQSNDKIDLAFFTAISRGEVFRKEGKITAIEFESIINSVVKFYGPYFLKRSFDKLSGQTWYISDQSVVQNTTAKLMSLEYSYKPMLSRSSIDSCNRLNKIFNDCNEAVKLCEAATFINIEHAETTINKAEGYAEDPYIKNCVSVKTHLDNVKYKIERSHILYLSKKVDELSNYRSMTQDYYENTFYPYVDDLIKKCSDCKPLYGVNNTGPLWLKAQSHYLNSKNYYRNN